MIKMYINLCTIAMFMLSLVACNNDASNANTENETTVRADNPEASTTVTETTTETKPVESNDLKTKLMGTWWGNHEPDGTDFNADGSYRMYMPAGAAGEGSAEEVYEKGSWSVEENFLLITPEGGEAKKLPVNWINDNLIYLGNLEGEYDESYGTKEDYAKEFGMTRGK